MHDSTKSGERIAALRNDRGVRLLDGEPHFRARALPETQRERPLDALYANRERFGGPSMAATDATRRPGRDVGPLS